MANKKKTVFGYTLMIIGITALICLIIFVLFGYKFLLNPDIEFETNQNITSTTKESENIAIPGFETWTIDANTTQVSGHIYNPETNNCYFIVTITLDKTNEVIYESKYIEPGVHLYNLELSKPLVKGQYEATLHYNTYSKDNLTPLNGAEVPFELVVK